MESFAHAEPLPLKEYTGDWAGPLGRGSDALSHALLELGVRRGSWTTSVLLRDDYRIKANRETVALYHQIQNKASLAPGTRHLIDLNAYHQRSRGIRVAYAGASGTHLSWELGASVLQGLELTDGMLSGTAEVVAEGDYDYSVNAAYFYRRDVLFSRPDAVAPEGEGLSLDMSLRWQTTAPFRASVEVRDVYGFLHWRRVSYTRAQASSAIKEYDDDGYVRYNPTLSGREGVAGFRQKLKPLGTAQADWLPGPKDTLGLILRANEINSYLGLRYERNHAENGSIGAEWIPRWSAAGLSVQYGQCSVQLLTDDLELSEARLFQLNLGFALQF